MTNKERKFAVLFYDTDNAYQSALRAGYAETTAAHARDWVVKNPKNSSRR